MVPDQSPEAGGGAPRKGSVGRGLVSLGVGTSVLVVGILLYYMSGPDENAERLRQFCSKTLNKQPIENVAAKTRELGFDVRELHDTLLITVPGKRLGQSCFLAIVEGKVSDVHSVVTH